ncbi:TonB-dependent receptor, partial [Rhizorhabdus wittichii]|uniref:TonB-dependent receptor n=1 Tax=Rhizorhabdus wittichii TaxID=160791 RepID=UPI001D00D26C
FGRRYGVSFAGRLTVTTRDEFFAPDLLPVLGIPSETLGSQFRQRTNAYAAFAHAEWTFAPRMTLVGGLRYTKERKTFDRATTFLCTGTTCNDLFAPVDNRYSTSNLSGKIGINYKVADRTLVYGSISRGFKSGGFQGQLTFDPSTLTPFRDEKLTSYEIGVKSRILPNLQVNLSAFNYEYRDAQIYGPLYDSPVGVLFGIGTAGDARVQGLEADVSWRPAAGLDIRGGLGFIDTKITKSIVAGVAKGSRLPNAPKLTLNGQVRYETQLADGLGADMTLSGSYQSQVAFDIVRSPAQAIEGGYVLANAEAGLSPGDRWRISIWAKNLFDKTYRTQAFFTTIGWTYFYGPPRTYGLNVSYKL